LGPKGRPPPGLAGFVDAGAPLLLGPPPLATPVAVEPMPVALMPAVAPAGAVPFACGAAPEFVLGAPPGLAAALEPMPLLAPGGACWGGGGCEAGNGGGTAWRWGRLAPPGVSGMSSVCLVVSREELDGCSADVGVHILYSERYGQWVWRDNENGRAELARAMPSATFVLQLLHRRFKHGYVAMTHMHCSPGLCCERYEAFLV
jgi:hypothetical protein